MVDADNKKFRRTYNITKYPCLFGLKLNKTSYDKVEYNENLSIGPVTIFVESNLRIIELSPL